MGSQPPAGKQCKGAVSSVSGTYRVSYGNHRKGVEYRQLAILAARLLHLPLTGYPFHSAHPNMLYGRFCALDHGVINNTHVPQPGASGPAEMTRWAYRFWTRWFLGGFILMPQVA